MTQPRVSPGIKTAAQIRVEARCGMAIRLERGEVVRVINTHGQQVDDTWAFVRDVRDGFMSSGVVLGLTGVLGDTVELVGTAVTMMSTSTAAPTISVVPPGPRVYSTTTFDDLLARLGGIA